MLTKNEIFTTVYPFLHEKWKATRRIIMVAELKLTDRQSSVLNAIKWFTDEPTTLDLATKLHLSTNGIAQTLESLVKLGLVLSTGGEDVKKRWAIVEGTEQSSDPSHDSLPASA
jgi:DNA-binding MarR family transcriptional regulator